MLELFEAWWLSYNGIIYGVGTYGLLALSVAITLSAGLLSLGSAAFMAIGAFSASLISLNSETPFIVPLSVGTLLPALLAYLIGLPLLRLKGVYLAMATLGLGEIIRVLFLNLEITGGAIGLNGIPERTSFLEMSLSLGLVLYLLYRLKHSRYGRAVEAIREDEIAANVQGIDVRQIKLGAFVLSAAVAGLGGALNAHYTFSISPSNYGFEAAIDYLTMAVLGGISGLPGPLIGAGILTLLPEVLRGLDAFRTSVSGLILILATLYLPQGLYSLRRVLKK